MKWLTDIQERAEKDITRITARLAELDAERKQLIKMRDAYKALTGHKAQATGAPEAPKENIKEMAMLILEEAGTPLALKDIYKKMLEMGMTFNGPNPRMSIYAAMNRNREIFKNRSDKRWELAQTSNKKSYADELTT